jgi:site-specific DNA recombinase
MKRCVCYGRVSTNLQDFSSQFEDLKRYADYQGYQIVKIFGEKVSGYSESVERAEYEAMKQFVIENQIHHILCWEISRFSRRTSVALKEIEFFSHHKINIFFKKENLNTLSDNATNKMILTIMSSVAELERSTILERSIRGRISSAQKGRRVGFPIMPYGYRDVGGVVEVDPEESLTIILMYEQAARGTSVRGIAAHLNSLQIPTRQTTRGKKRQLKSGSEVEYLWRNNTVRKILQSQLYKGERPYRDLIIPFPAIVDEDLWNRVQTRFKNHLGYINRTKYNYLLKGKLICGKCHLHYGARTDPRYEHKPSFYFCHAAKDKGIRCTNGQFSASILDQKVWSILMLHGPRLTQHLQDEANQQAQQTDRITQIKYFQEEIDQIQSKKKRLRSLFVDGFIAEDELRKMMLDFQFAEQKAEREISKLEKEAELYAEGPENLRDRFRKLVTEQDFEIKKDFIEAYLDRIVITKLDEPPLRLGGMQAMILKAGGKVQTYLMKDPHPQEKVVYLEIWVVGSDKPLKAIVSNGSICYVNPLLEI